MEAAEFDKFAEEYDKIHLESIGAATGERPEFFHQYKVAVLEREARRRNVQPRRILDFGSGIGNSTPFLHRAFPDAGLSGADISQRSLDVAEARFPGLSTGLQIADRRIPAEDNSFCICFSACVFHHIPHEEHVHWLGELWRVTRPGGLLAIFEHNPLNPLTVRLVNNCPFDENAVLVRSSALARNYRRTGWQRPVTRFHLFFPHALGSLRGLEPYLAGVPLGGQYSVIAIKQ